MKTVNKNPSKTISLQLLLMKTNQNKKKQTLMIRLMKMLGVMKLRILMLWMIKKKRTLKCSQSKSKSKFKCYHNKKKKKLSFKMIMDQAL